MDDMHAVNLAGRDLNLLVALDALLAERNVTRAATRIGLTQPAMSHALARLRVLFDDPLFVRTPRGMIPTARAIRLEEPIRRALTEIERCVHDREQFDPKTARGAFTIATSDLAELVLLPPLLARLSREAPGIDLRVLSVPDEWVRALEDGACDVVINPGMRDTPAGVRRQKLFDERFVCVMREGHPAAKKPLTLARFVELPHALVAPRGRVGGFVDDALAARGLERRIALTVPHFLVAPIVVSRSDLVVTIAERVARTFAAAFGLVMVDPPLPLPGFSMYQWWHERRHQDPAHAFIRAVVREAAQDSPDGRRRAGTKSRGVSRSVP